MAKKSKIVADAEARAAGKACGIGSTVKKAVQYHTQPVQTMKKIGRAVGETVGNLQSGRSRDQQVKISQAKKAGKLKQYKG